MGSIKPAMSRRHKHFIVWKVSAVTGILLYTDDFKANKTKCTSFVNGEINYDFLERNNIANA